MGTDAPLETIGRRYVLHEQLGQGGMGAVYRATDRLTGEAVALKRVTTPAEQLTFASRGGKTNLPLALAQEFRTLASLHHPNIIRVLDYGFDEGRCPFFTMTLLENARTIVEAGRGQDLGTQVDLLVQTLQALAYLHRRNTLHRDLKPENVLVAAGNGHVQVLDFGVSVTTTRTMRYLTQTTIGTLTHLAPELLGGAPVTRAADLYAVGVMACEILTGRFPYNNTNVAVLVTEILTKPVDVRSIGVGDALAAVLEKLLAKRSEERYDDAGTVIRDLCAATGCALPLETVEIRESYLQSAKLVGRNAELAQLTATLDRVLTGRGSAWLVGGESGVGKSRLVEELRTLALVKGALVLVGQGVSEGSSPYHLWRDALRWLALTADLSIDEAGVLKPLVPDMGDLLGRQVPDAQPLDPEASQNRTLHVAVEVLRRGCLSGPVLVILEDLHWAGSNSLALLDRLARAVSDIPLLLLGTYRDDERPHLPDELPHLGVLKLERLTEEGIAELSESMVGVGGREPQVLALLRRETEGNPFFLVEVVRALAEEAGRLEDIGRMSLPDEVFAGGVHQVIRRRLSRVPMEARGPLLLAAYAGMELDLEVLRALAPELDVPRWLTLCADVAVLEAAGGQWRFSHHQLRDRILDDLPDDARPSVHRQVAEAIEAVHPGADDRAATLAYHWEQAQEAQKAVSYLLLAATQARASYANEEAIRYLRRALVQLERQQRGEPSTARAEVGEELGDLLKLTGRQDEARAAYQRALSQTPSDDLVRQSRLLRKIGLSWLNAEKRLAACDEAEATLERAPTRTREWWQEWVNVQLDRVWGYYSQATHEEMALLLEKIRPVVAQYGTPAQRHAFAQSYVGMKWRQNRYRVDAEMLAMCRDAVTSAQASGDLRSVADSLFRLGFTLLWHGDLEEAEDVLLEALALSQRVGDTNGQLLGMTYLSVTYRKRGQILETQQYATRSLDAAMEGQRADYIAMAQANQAWVAWRGGDLAQARVLGESALALWHERDLAYPFQWAALYPLIGVALAEDRTSDAVSHARALLDPRQQYLPEAMTALLEETIETWEGGEVRATRACLARVLTLARELC